MLSLRFSIQLLLVRKRTLNWPLPPLGTHTKNNKIVCLEEKDKEEESS